MLKRSNKFFCKECKRYFDEPEFYEEKRELYSPPYERVAVCPVCNGDNFMKFNHLIEKIQVAEKLLPAIMQINRHTNALKDVFGMGICNSDLDGSVEIMVEVIGDMFDFLDVDMQIRILKMDSEKELNKILTYLKG